MVSINQISVCILSAILLFIIILNIIDFLKKRKLKNYPFMSFIVPCYNDGESVGHTIESIYDSYPEGKFEVIVVNDKSKDNSLEIIKQLQKKYNFRILDNKKNLGVSESVNRAATLAKGAILWRIDADVLINKGAVYDVLARFQSNEKIVAVSCPYRIKNKGFLGRMQELEVNMMTLLTTAQNPHSAVSLTGGCLIVKKDAFEKVGGFSVNMLTEDLDLAYKLNELNMKVEQSPYMVSAYSTDNIRDWYHQKLRWITGGTQTMIKHFKTLMKHPLYVIFLILYSVLTLLFMITLIGQIIFFKSVWADYELLRNTTTTLLSLKLIWLDYGIAFFKSIFFKFYFILFSIPYTFSSIRESKHLYKIFYSIPFTLIYWPAYSIVSAIGIVKGIIAYRKLKEGKRSW